MIPEYTQNRDFWRLVLMALVLGVFGAVSGLAFVAITGIGAS